MNDLVRHDALRRREIYTKREAADYLRVSVRSIENYLASGRLGHFKIGKSVRISRAALDAFLQRHFVEPDV